MLTSAEHKYKGEGGDPKNKDAAVRAAWNVTFWLRFISFIFTLEVYL